MLSGRGASEDDQVNGGRVVGGMLFDEAIATGEVTATGT